MNHAPAILQKRIDTVIRLFGPKRDAEEDALRQIRPLLYASHVPENFMDFGTPHAAEERKQLRRERLWRHTYRAGIAFVLLGLGFVAGYNVHLRMPPTQPQTNMFTQQIGCVGDWISGGLYCHGYDAHGNEVASRSY